VHGDCCFIYTLEITFWWLLGAQGTSCRVPISFVDQTQHLPNYLDHLFSRDCRCRRDNTCNEICCQLLIVCNSLQSIQSQESKKRCIVLMGWTMAGVLEETPKLMVYAEPGTLLFCSLILPIFLIGLVVTTAAFVCAGSECAVAEYTGPGTASFAW